MIRVTFDVNHLRYGVLRFIAERVNDHAAADRAVRARTTGFACVRNLERLSLSVEWPHVEAERGQRCTAGDRGLDEDSSRDVHDTPPAARDRLTWRYAAS